MSAVQGRTLAYGDATIDLRYPATWVVEEGEEGIAQIRDPNAASLFDDRIVVRHEILPGSGLPAGSPLLEAATAWTLKQSRALDTFRHLATDDGGRSATEPGLTLAGLPAIRIDYAYVADPGANLGRPAIPVVVRGRDTLILTGDVVTVISGQGNANGWATFEPVLEEILRSVRLASAGGDGGGAQ